MADEQQPARPELRLDQYPHRVSDNIRFGDLDAQGHVNNTVIAGYLETGRVMMFRRPGLGIDVEGATVVLVKTEITYLRELHWPGVVDIGSRVARIGRTSFTMDQAVFRDGICAAHGLASLVLIDNATRRPKPFPDAFRSKLEGWTLGTAGQP